MYDFRAQFNLASFGYDIGIYADNGKRVVTSVTVTVEDYKSGEMFNPAVRLDENDAQNLFQALWTAGLRPNLGEGTQGHVDALKYHLEDMRKLVFVITGKERTDG